MRALAIIALAIGVSAAFCVAYMAVHRYRQWRRGWLESRSRWVDVIQSSERTTYVSVQRIVDTRFGRHVLDVQWVGFVSHSDPDWHERMKALRLKAWDRAIDLNTPPLAG